MVKSKTIYVCQNCGAKETKWTGRCNVCGEWNSFVEEVEVTSKSQSGNCSHQQKTTAINHSQGNQLAALLFYLGDVQFPCQIQAHFNAFYESRLFVISAEGTDGVDDLVDFLQRFIVH